MTTTKAHSASKLLGEVVTWDMRGCEVGIDEVRDALDQAGLNPDAAKELTTRSAFSRACKHLKESRTIDKLETSRGVIHFQFTKKHLEGGRYEFDYECRVAVDTDSGDVECAENPALAKEAKQLLDFAMQTRNAQDITRMVQRMFADHADLYPINPRKGVAYFVPECHRDFTKKVRKFLKAIGGDLLSFPVPEGDEEGNRSVQESVSAGLNDLLEELDDAVSDWDETTRKSTMEKASARYEEIEYKIEAYATYLRSSQDKLKDRLKDARQRLMDQMSDLGKLEEPEEVAA